MSPPMIIDRFAGEYAFLSNFYPAQIISRAGVYPTVEHAFQASKAPTLELHQQIAAAPTPGEAKRLGRRVELPKGWNTHARYIVMEWLLQVKFCAGSELAHRLLCTHDALLIEGNTWHDQTWGDCRCGKIGCKEEGHNLLGWMLMKQRDYLRSLRQE